MLRRTVAVVDMVAYSRIASILEENISASTVADLNRQIQGIMSRALDAFEASGTHTVVSKPGDGIILLFEQPDDAHWFAWNVHLLAKEHNDQRNESTAERWFRAGIATGDVIATPSGSGLNEYAGMTIAKAVRLEAAADQGGILIDKSSFEGLSDRSKCLYAQEETVKGKRDEQFRARRCQVTTVVKLQASEKKHFILDRRALLGGGAALLGCAAFAGWREMWRLDRWEHPLPSKRFVALVAWPSLSNSKVTPMIASAVETIGNELARAEAFDSNFLIIPHGINQAGATADQLNDIKESLGANLIMAVSGALEGGVIRILMNVIGDARSKPLREGEVRVTADEQTTVAAKLVAAAVAMLDLHRYSPDQKRLSAGTESAEAYAQFQKGEVAVVQPNDTGLEDAIQNYKNAINLDHNYALAHARLAMAYERLSAKNHDPDAMALAGANAQRAISIDNNSATGHIALAGYFDQSGLTSKAMDEYRTALRIDPTNPIALIWQAQTFADLNLWSEAEAAYQRIVRERPNEWLGHNNFGALLYSEGKYMAALSQYHLAHLASPRNFYPPGNIGVVSLQLGRISDAIAFSTKSLDLKPTSLALTNLAQVMRSQADLPQARDFAERATSSEPEESTAWLESADCCSLQGRKKDADSRYKTAEGVQARQLEVNPAFGPGIMLLALYQKKSASKENVSDLVVKAEANHAGDIESQLYKVRILELSGQREDAVRAALSCLARGVTRFQLEQVPDLQELVADPTLRGTTLPTAP
jgi:Tfp pilus assembly protein PilF/class 3 adenylate cyclase